MQIKQTDASPPALSDFRDNRGYIQIPAAVPVHAAVVSVSLVLVVYVNLVEAH